MYHTREEADQARLTGEQVVRIMEEHGLDFEDFLLDIGNKEEYSGVEVLDWLGY